ncbi:MAG: hypothetical protein GQ532_02035 [Methylomarinum sp.]|nr:hypothetical protein [Methylomarinum sp.]
MNWFVFFILSCFGAAVFAEHTEQRNQVYNGTSQLTAENINQAVDILRNPTVMSSNFRKAMANIMPGISTAKASTLNLNDDEESDMPFIDLVAKIIVADKPSTVVIRVNDHTFHLMEGGTASQMINRKIVNIRVDKITANNVTIFISPFEQLMVLP